MDSDSLIKHLLKILLKKYMGVNIIIKNHHIFYENKE